LKSGDLTKLFGVSHQTVSNWVKEFENFLSETARKQDSRQSIFTEQDFIIMATIAELSQKQKLPYEAIREQLSQGYRVEDARAATVGYEDGRMVPAATVEHLIDATHLRVQLEQVQAERDKLMQLLSDVQAQAKAIQEDRETLRREKDTQISALQTKIAELERALGRAEGELELRRKRGWFGGG
jgi:DNA-binding transcriptional MerR regulator